MSCQFCEAKTFKIPFYIHPPCHMHNRKMFITVKAYVQFLATQLTHFFQITLLHFFQVIFPLLPLVLKLLSKSEQKTVLYKEKRQIERSVDAFRWPKRIK